MKLPLLVLLLLSQSEANVDWLCDWFPDWDNPFVDCDADSSVPSPSPPGGNQPISCNPNPASSINSEYDISFAYNNVLESDRSVFEEAAVRWRRVIIGDLQEATVTGDSRCGAWPSTVDDLVSILYTRAHLLLVLSYSALPDLSSDACAAFMVASCECKACLRVL